MSETIAITGKSVRLFKGHYTRMKTLLRQLRNSVERFLEDFVAYIPHLFGRLFAPALTSMRLWRIVSAHVCVHRAGAVFALPG
ncbi:MAG: hypothetical protein ACREYE_08985 [Gammaproteobacteria bacterium]